MKTSMKDKDAEILKLRKAVRMLQRVCETTVQNCEDALSGEWDYNMDTNSHAKTGWQMWQSNAQKALDKSLKIVPRK